MQNVFGTLVFSVVLAGCSFSKNVNFDECPLAQLDNQKGMSLALSEDDVQIVKAYISAVKAVQHKGVTGVWNVTGHSITEVLKNAKDWQHRRNYAFTDMIDW